MKLPCAIYLTGRFRNYVPFLELVSLGDDELILRDNKKDRIVVVKAKGADGGKVKFYCEMDDDPEIMTTYGLAIESKTYSFPFWFSSESSPNTFCATVEAIARYAFEITYEHRKRLGESQI